MISLCVDFSVTCSLSISIASHSFLLATLRHHHHLYLCVYLISNSDLTRRSPSLLALPIDSARQSLHGTRICFNEEALCVGDHFAALSKCKSLFDENIEEAKLLLCVTKIGCSWVLYDFDFNEDMIIIYTSKPSKQGLGKDVNIELPWMRQFLAWRLNDKKYLQYKLDWLNNIPTETKLEDSGIFCLRFITSLMLRKPSNEVLENTTNEIALLAYNVLMDKSNKVTVTL